MMTYQRRRRSSSPTTSTAASIKFSTASNRRWGRSTRCSAWQAVAGKAAGLELRGEEMCCNPSRGNPRAPSGQAAGLAMLIVLYVADGSLHFMRACSGRKNPHRHSIGRSHRSSNTAPAGIVQNCCSLYCECFGRCCCDLPRRGSSPSSAYRCSVERSRTP